MDKVRDKHLVNGIKVKIENDYEKINVFYLKENDEKLNLFYLNYNSITQTIGVQG